MIRRVTIGTSDKKPTLGNYSNQLINFQMGYSARKTNEMNRKLETELQYKISNITFYAKELESFNKMRFEAENTEIEYMIDVKNNLSILRQRVEAAENIVTNLLELRGAKD